MTPGRRVISEVPEVASEHSGGFTMDGYVFLYGGFLMALLILGLVMTDRLSSKEHFPKVEDDDDDKRDMREYFEQERTRHREAQQTRRTELRESELRH